MTTRNQTTQKPQLKPWAPKYVWAIRERKTGLWNKRGFGGLVGRTGVVYKARNHASCHITGTIEQDIRQRRVRLYELDERERKRCIRNARRRFARRFELVRYAVQPAPDEHSAALRGA